MYYHNCISQPFGCAIRHAGHLCLAGCKRIEVQPEDREAVKQFLWAMVDAEFTYECRYMLGYTQVEMAKALGVSLPTVVARENGRRKLGGMQRHEYWEIIERTPCVSERPPEPKMDVSSPVEKRICPECKGDRQIYYLAEDCSRGHFAPCEKCKGEGIILDRSVKIS